MDNLLAELLGFPLIFYTIPMMFLILFWLVSLLGLMDIEVFDFDIDTDADTDVDGSHWLEKLGFDGVPFVVVLTLLDFFGLAITYLGRKHLMPLFDGILTATAWGAILAILALLIAIPITAICVKPLRKAFVTHEGVTKHELVGTICTVTTLKVTQTFGQATSDDGMVLAIRAKEPNDLCKGNRVALIEFIQENDCFTVVSEAELHAIASSPV